MLYRTAVTFIWIFWLVMVSLLIRSEYFPEHASLYRLPIDFVTRKVFRSDTGSDLVIYYKQTVVGKMTVEPAPLAQNLLKGTIKIDWPVLGKNYQAESFYTLVFSSKLDLQHFNFSTHMDQGNITLEGARSENKVTANLHMPGLVGNRMYKWSELENKRMEIVADELSKVEGVHLPPGMLEQSSQDVHWFAASANLSRGGKKFDAFLIATEGNRDYWIKIWLTPSGEVILIQTSPAIGLTIENPSLIGQI